MPPAVHASKTDDWLTPPDILCGIRKSMPIRLDPCCCATSLSHTGARYVIALPSDGLIAPWVLGNEFDVEEGCVFVNPPYSDLRRWLAKCCRESEVNGVRVVALVPFRAEAHAFHESVYGRAAIFVFCGRLSFHRDIHVEYACEVAKEKPRAKRLQDIEDAAASGEITYPSDPATFPSVLVTWDAAPVGLDAVFRDGLEGRWLR